MRSYDMNELYRKALCAKDNRREIYERAINAALENLMSWERLAIADGYDVTPITDTGMGTPVPYFDGSEVRFVQSYGVKVREAK